VKRIRKQEYTAEFKEQAVKRADEVGSIGRVAEELGLAEQTLRNWVKAAKAGKLNPAAAKQITAEQMELSRLRAGGTPRDGVGDNKKSSGIFREGAAVKYAWIEKQRRSFPLPILCDALSVSQSGFRAWQAGGTPDRERLTDAQTLVLIRTIHQEVRQAYGARRIHAELRGRGYRIGLPRIERLMRENGIRARHKRRYKATTDSKHRLPVADNVLDRQFVPNAPNGVWTGDITYIATAEGWLYLAVVIDLFNREVIGWSIKPRMTTDLVLDALSMAWFRRRPAPGVLFHSDRGSQYASHAYQARLAAYGMRGSMSRKGNCWDNAPTESFFNSLKNERVHGVSYATRSEAASDLFQYIAVFYNRSRRHSTLGYLSPTTFLQTWIEQQIQQEMAA